MSSSDFPEDTETALQVSVSIGKHCTNYRVETEEALVQATSMIQDSNDSCQQVVFLSDALSVIESLENRNKLPSLTAKAVQQVGRTDKKSSPPVDQRH